MTKSVDWPCNVGHTRMLDTLFNGFNWVRKAFFLAVLICLRMLQLWSLRARNPFMEWDVGQTGGNLKASLNVFDFRKPSLTDLFAYLGAG